MKGFAAQFNQLFGELYECVKKSEQETLPGHQKLPLSAGEFHLLEQIDQTPEGAISVSELAKRLQVAKPSASVAVNKLLRKGFVEKAPSDCDGRSILVSLTHQGKLACAYHSYCRRQHFAQRSHAYTEEEQGTLLRCMETLKRFCRAIRRTPKTRPNPDPVHPINTISWRIFQ